MTERQSKSQSQTQPQKELAATQDRMSAEERRNDLIEIALGMLRDEGAEQVTIGTIAERASVTRTLVYKHFANRQELISATYRREAAKLHESIRSMVNQVQGFELRVRAFVDAVLGAVDSHGWLFGPQEPLSHVEGFQQEQNQRDRRAVRFFAQMASEEYGLSLKETTSAMSILLSGITSLRLQAMVLTAPKDRQYLADLYVDLVVGAFAGLAERRSSGGGTGRGVPKQGVRLQEEYGAS